MHASSTTQSIDTIGRETIHVPRDDDDDDDDDDSIRDATRPRCFPLLARTLESNAPTNDDDDAFDDRDHARGVVRHDRARVAV